MSHFTPSFSYFPFESTSNLTTIRDFYTWRHYEFIFVTDTTGDNICQDFNGLRQEKGKAFGSWTVGDEKEFGLG